MSDDRPDVVPYVLTDLDDVDGTPVEGASLTYTDGVWVPTAPKIPLHFMEDYTDTGFEAFINASAGTFGLKRDTDLPPGHPEPSSDTVIAAGTIGGNVGKNVVRIQSDGVYHTSWQGFVRCDAADDGDTINGTMYPTLSDDNYGPHWWFTGTNQIVSGTGSIGRTVTFTGSVTVWMPAGTELAGYAVLNVTTDPNLAGFHGSIVRLG